MSRGWIPYLLIAPFAFANLVGACSPGSGANNEEESNLTGGNGATGNRAGSTGIYPTGSGGSSMGGSIMVGGPVDPCADAGKTPDECEVMSQPGCGDGAVNTAAEVCDDGNNLPGDC